MSEDKDKTEEQKNAYRQVRKTKEGCQHKLGCKCDTPYHLRPSTPAEEAHEERIRKGR